MEIDDHEKQLVRLNLFSATVAKTEFKEAYSSSFQHIRTTLVLLDQLVDIPFQSATLEDCPLSVQICSGKIEALRENYLTMEKVLERIDPKKLTPQEAESLEQLLNTLEVLEVDIHRQLAIDQGRKTEWGQMASQMRGLTAQIRKLLLEYSENRMT